MHTLEQFRWEGAAPQQRTPGSPCLPAFAGLSQHKLRQVHRNLCRRRQPQPGSGACLCRLGPEPRPFPRLVPACRTDRAVQAHTPGRGRWAGHLARDDRLLCVKSFAES